MTDERFWYGVMVGAMGGTWLLAFAVWARAKYWERRLHEARQEHVLLEAEEIIREADR